MKNFYFTLILFVFGFSVSGQTSSEVGITEGQLSVSLSGAANYTIPIAVPPGINGIVPQISLVYNSQGGNGAAGYGWNIGGISTISRIPSTKFHDGVIDPVDFNALDRFGFDGQRLIVKNGTAGAYGANGTVYETENFSNVKITSYGVHPDGSDFGPAYFIVEYPDGSKAYYGSSADSRSITDWAITYWENPQGIRISYQYTIANNNLNIASIKYGGLVNSTPINEIRFFYIARKRPEQSYVGNQSVLKSNILSTIKVFSGGVGYKNYVLGYDETYKDYQRLITITEKNGDNSKSYNPTTFTYGDLVANNLTSIAPSILDLAGIDYQTMGNISGDFDGDGKTDIILYPKTTNDAKKKYWLYSNISDVTLNSGIAHSIGAFEEILPTTILEGDSGSGYKLMTKKGWTVVKYDASSNLATFSSFSSSLTAPIALQYEKSYKFPQLIYYSEHPLSCVQNRPSTKHVESISKFYLNGDFNGDSLTDIIVIERDFQYSYLAPCDVNNQPLSVNDTYSGITYFINMDKRLTTNYVFNAGNLGIDSASKIEIADVNGDGKSDIIVIKKGSVKVYSLNENNKFILLFEKKDDSIVTDKILLLGDYNGDGKADFVIPSKVGQDNWDFFMSTGTNFNKINGQIGIVYNQSDIRKYYQEITNNNDWTMSLNENSFIANDFNGDGKTDILNQQNFTVEADNSGNPNTRAKGTPQMTKFQIALNMSFTESTVKFLPTVTFSYVANKINRYPIPVFANLNDINKTFKYSLITGNSIYGLDMIWYNTFDVLLKKITNGNGVTESISYKPLDTKSKEGQYSVYFNSTHIENYPNIDILNDPNFFVVSMLEKKSSDSYKKKLFQYYGAVSNVSGLGFLGFRSTVTTNWHDKDDAIISTLSKNDMSLRGANVENYTVLGLHSPLISDPNTQIISGTIVKEGDYTITESDNLIATQSITLKPDTWIKPGSTFSAKINEDANTGTSSNTPQNFITKSLLTYESELLPNKVYKIKNTITKQFNGLENTSSETRVVYDEINNPLKSITYLKESGATIQTTVSDVSYYDPTASPYVIGRPKSKNQSVTISGDVMTTEELYFYQNSLLTQIKKKGTNTDYITEDNAYDAFGNITQKTITASGLPARVTSYGYDPSGRFLTRSTDVEGLSTAFVYNSDGTLKSETNPYGLTTSYLYDSWFRKTTTTDYLGKKKSYVYTRSGTKTVVTSTADDGSASEETFDDLGRKIRAGSKNIMGTFAYVDYLYDIQDRNYKVSEPYFGSVGTQWSETKYDVYGRVFQNIAFTGKVTDINYSGLTTTVNDGTKSKTSTKNAIGNVVSMTDIPGGTITYTYFANGNLKESEYAGVKTTIKQDGWGRKTELKDSSAGIYTYDYNVFGETTSETTPNGTTSYIVDPASGKVTQKTIKGINTDSKTTYFYDPSSKLLIGSELKDSSSGTTNTSSTLIVYDDSKRVFRTVETTPYAVFTKEFTYDDFGRVNTETSTAAAGGKSSSKTIRNTYKNGAHWQLLDNGTSAILWQTNEINARGQLKNALNGPTTITNMYDDFGFVTQFKYDKTSGLTNILTLNTLFDAKKGNLTSRSNSLFGRNESFAYDAQDRLTEYTNALGVQERQMYDDQGRITQNNLGVYNYSKEKPYQNTTIAVAPEALTYYTAKPTQIISYNTFKSPVQIEEKGIDKISFLYNDGNSRTAMFYGGLQDKMLERPFRKYYSGDGSMEIKENQGVFEFITYIGGDGYSAPIVLKSNGTIQDYLYLQRDYQGSIIAITNQTGAVVEKRFFDAWGSIVKVQDGAGNVLAGLTVLDRGYTGHEHLQSVGLINMNGRIYDPKLHRFLQPDNNVQDPFNTQNYNRYGYVLNNPLVYTDPSGEFWNFVVMAISAYIYAGAATGEANPIKWNVNNLMGAVSGVGSAYATGATNSYIDNYNNKPALGASAVGPGFNGNPFVNDDDYIAVTSIKNDKKGGNDNSIPCVICHHTLDSGEIFSGAQSKFGNGLQNTVFGVVGTVGAVAAIPETGGTSGLALTLTIGQVSIGFAQMADSFNERPNEILHSYSTVPGLIAGQRGSKYAPMIDFTSSWITGSMGNAPILRGNTMGTWNSAKELYRGEKVMYNAVSIYSTYGTYNSGFSLLFNNKQ